jgi:predicted alpha/beta superfamily hydrolase
MSSRTAACLTLLLALAVPAGARSESTSPSTKPQAVRQACTIQELTVKSEVLNEERTLLVRLPHGYDDGQNRFSVLYVLDADWHFDIAAADVGFLSEVSYVSSHPSPQLIVVGITNRDRNRDFTPTHSAQFRNMRFPTSGGGAAFRRFLTEEVVPLIDDTYRTHPHRILAGWSLGGLFTFDTLLSGASPFSAYLAISPSLWWDDELIPTKLESESERSGPSKPVKLVVTLGAAEDGGLVDRATRRVLANLEARPIPNVSVELVELEGLGHNYSPKMAYFLGLATLFADLRAPAEVRAKGLDAVDAYYAELSLRYGFDIPTPEDIYSGLGWKLFEEGRTDDAAKVFLTWNERHPDSTLAVASLGSFYRETGDPKRAIELMSRAIDLENASAQPRAAFIFDLERDIRLLRNEKETADH